MRPPYPVRLRVQLRRVRPTTVGQVLEHGDLRLDTETHRVHRGGAEVKLGPTEFRLLACLMERPGRVFTREALLDRVWGRDIYVETRTVDVHVGRLQRLGLSLLTLLSGEGVEGSAMDEGQLECIPDVVL